MIRDLVATYDSTEDARSAVIALERRGIEAADIELRGPAAEDAAIPRDGAAQREADMAVMSQLGRRALGGAMAVGLGGLALGSVLGATLVGGAGPTVGLGVALGALCFGLGFFWGGATALPVSAAWADSWAADPADRAMVVVHVPGDAPKLTDELADVLRAAGARRLELV